MSRHDMIALLIAFLATLGVGSIVAALLSRWSVISNLRQAWINALRDDLASYLKEIQALHFEAPNGGFSQSRGQALLAYHRILLRLNTEEGLHIELADKLEDLLDIGDPTEDAQRVDDAISLARKILKQEWNVTKYGIFADIVASSK